MSIYLSNGMAQGKPAGFQQGLLLQDVQDPYLRKTGMAVVPVRSSKVGVLPVDRFTSDVGI